jgi:hypothetical protein
MQKKESWSRGWKSRVVISLDGLRDFNQSRKRGRWKGEEEEEGRAPPEGVRRFEIRIGNTRVSTLAAEILVCHPARIFV